MTTKSAWITGARGLIGSHLIQQAKEKSAAWNVVSLSRQVLDLTDFAAVQQRFNEDDPFLLIHCAAMSDTTQCEEHPAEAQQINVDATGFLAELFTDRRMVFFSTDLVFDGVRGHYREGDAVNPLNHYARCKVEAEARVLAHSNHVILRTSINGGASPSGNRGFNEGLELAWKNDLVTRLFTDEFRCPIPASVTARAAWEVAQTDATGVYHLAGAKRLSRLEIGELLAKRHPELNPRIEAISLKDYEGPPRAADASLNCDKAQALLSFKLPGLAEWLQANPDEPF